MPASRSMVPGDPSPTAAMRSQSSPALLDGLVAGGSQIVDAHDRPVVSLGRDADRRQRPAHVVDHPALDVRPAQVDAEEIGRRSVAGIHQSVPGDVAETAVNQELVGSETIYGFGWNRSTAPERACFDYVGNPCLI